MATQQATYETLQTSINALNVEVAALRLLYEDSQRKIEHHDKILVRGWDDHLPLAEVVRNLTNTVADYIAQKDKEEQARLDREKSKAEEQRKIKMIIIGFMIPAGITFAIQAVVFFFRIYPILESLAP